MPALARWHTLTLGDPPCYLLRGPEQRTDVRVGPPWAKFGEPIAKVSVIAPARGGEVRGYWLFRGALWLAHPLCPLEWAELDAEVARVTGLEVRDRQRFDGAPAEGGAT